GTDTVLSSVDWILGSNLENLTLTGSAINGSGNELDNVIIGNSQSNNLEGHDGNDTLDGGAGADWMAGDLGDDTYIFDNVGDVVSTNYETGGYDTIRSSVNVDLTAYGAVNIEAVELTGTANLNVWNGNNLD